ncbi:Uncharacterized protein FWK35_00032285, partial [Aphis craccivora]
MEMRLKCSYENEHVRTSGNTVDTYKDALASVISKGDIEDNVSNSIPLTEGNHTYTIRCPVAPKCDDYYVIQHYKTSAIKDI